MSYTYNAERIRNKLAYYSKSSVLMVVIEYLNKPVKTEFERLQKQPALSYLLIEWLFQVDQVANPRIATLRDIHHLLNEIYNLQSQAVNMQPEYDAYLSIRKLIISQLRIQKPLLGQLNGLMRLYVIMTKSPQSNWFKVNFNSTHGFELKVFFIICMWFIWKFRETHILRYERILTELSATMSVDKIARLLKLIGANLSELEQLLRSKKDESIQVDAYFSPTILTYKPLIFLKDSVIIPDSFLLRQSLCDFALHDYVARNHEQFRSKFTSAFELYTENLISDSGQIFTTENYLNRILKEKKLNSKVCDFVIHGTDFAFFIDAKGIEPNRLEQASSNPTTLRDKIKKRVSIGTEQCFACAASCEQHGIMTLPPRDKRFSLVVTHQSFYFLNGHKVQSQIYPDFYSDLVKRYGEVIPLENIYFITIEDFEKIMLLVKKHDVLMGDFFLYCVDQDATHRTTVFDISQHIIGFCNKYQIDRSDIFENPALEEAFNELTDQLVDYVEQGSSYWRKRGASSVADFLGLHFHLTDLLGVNEA